MSTNVSASIVIDLEDIKFFRAVHELALIALSDPELKPKLLKAGKSRLASLLPELIKMLPDQVKEIEHMIARGKMINKFKADLERLDNETE